MREKLVNFGLWKTFATLPWADDQMKKVREEVDELAHAVAFESETRVKEEFADVLQSLANLAKVLHVEDITYYKIKCYSSNRARGRMYEGEELG